MEVTRLFEFAAFMHKTFPKQDAFGYKENGTWKTCSTARFVEESENISHGLLANGLMKDDKVAIISNNRPEWNFADIGILQAGGIDVPIYPTASETDLQFILNDAQVKFVFVSNQDLFDKVKRVASGISSIMDIFTFNKVNGARHYNDLLEDGKKNKDLQKLNSIRDSIQGNSLATILYTSGTTGQPKGVMLSHTNLISNIKATYHLSPAHEKDRALSFLPLNHVYERMLTYLYMYLGISIYYAESLDTIGDNIREVKPMLFTAVPRLLEKVYDRIVSKGNEQKGIKKALFFWALNLGLRYELNGANGWWYEAQLKVANKLIFNKWREALGGNVGIIVSGGAALQPRLARVFWAAGIPVLEGYGLTETSPVIAINNLEPNSARFGTVGPILKNMEVKIADDGEILCKGPNIMLGYYKHPELTAEVIDREGWFHTGDIGVIEDNRFLKITDRKKEIFKTSGGKYIAPQLIENKLKESPFIEQVLVIGENQKFPSALIVPAFAYVKEWLSGRNISAATNEEISDDEEVKKRIWQEVKEVNKGLNQYEMIKKIEIMPREWMIEKGEMTPKLSLKRKVILDENRELIQKLYGE
jgi:long-chain acyl-CoA synthetase